MLLQINKDKMPWYIYIFIDLNNNKANFFYVYKYWFEFYKKNSQIAKYLEKWLQNQLTIIKCIASIKRNWFD